MTRSERVEMFMQRYENAEDIFTGEPLTGSDFIYWIGEKAGKVTARIKYEVLSDDVINWAEAGVCEAPKNQDAVERALRRWKDLGFH